MGEPLNLCTGLARHLRQCSTELVGFFEDGKGGLGASGDVTYEVDEVVEDALAEFFNSCSADAVVITEGSGEVTYGSKPEYVFLVDPLDGSRNIRRNLPFYGCSVAAYDVGVKEISEALASCVCRFDAQEMFTASGDKAWLNGEGISSSSKLDLEDSVLSLGAHFADSHNIYSSFLEGISGMVSSSERGIWVKCLGATAIELCYLADGRIDLLVDLRAGFEGLACPKSFDVAAGLKIASCAFAVCEYGSSNIPSKVGLDPKVGVQVVAAGNQTLFNVLANTLR